MREKGKRKRRRELIELAIREFAGKKTMKEIAADLGVVVSTVSKYAAQMGISLELDVVKSERERARAFIEANHHRLTAEETANKLRMSRATVYYTAWTMGISFRRKDELQRDLRTESKGMYFNEHARENWLV